MPSIVNDNLRESFFIRLYFNTDEGFFKAGIKRAYLDFNRTLKIKDEKRAIQRQAAEEFLLKELFFLTETELENQDKFDDYHRQLCENLREVWNQLSFGQAQKWINMTLKYWLAFGDKHICGIDKNSKFFHIPIDRIILKEMFDENPPRAWSKIDKYKVYFDYQKRHRAQNTGNYPIVDEFCFFNDFKPEKKG